ncbi:hypothetical protein QFZ28_003135 [Neobacillus niacini]|uniref:hypothetical protein n=1 Tax=Neobacillus niacini TaxID=86668 RepID=UPI002783B99E|nr:hypothetical protein [Neobacillus niacini]MDQ1002735.1 hypothetical protein [Neobacillus niacini]
MRSKERGHFCKGCVDFLPNEKFSGRGHREHLCKECKKAGKLVSTESNSHYNRNFHLLSKAIRNCMIVYLCKKYYETMDNGHSFDYEELIYNEYVEISKKRRQHLELILSIQHLK